MIVNIHLNNLNKIKYIFCAQLSNITMKIITMKNYYTAFSKPYPTRSFIELSTVFSL